MKHLGLRIFITMVGISLLSGCSSLAGVDRSLSFHSGLNLKEGVTPSNATVLATPLSGKNQGASAGCNTCVH